MSREIKNIKSRIAWVSGIIYLMLAVVLIRLYYVSLVEGPELRAKSRDRVIERHIIEAKRGDIYSADGKTLATTKPVYKIHFDAVTVDKEIFEAEVDALGVQLATVNPKYSASGWSAYLREERSKKRRYIPLASKLNFSELQTDSSIPYSKERAHRGGLIVEEDYCGFKWLLTSK